VIASGGVPVEENSLKGAVFQIVEGGAVVVGEWAIVGNTKDTIYLDPAGDSSFSSSLAGKAFRVMGRYVDVWTAGSPGLPLERVKGRIQPSAQIRIGFAACSGFDESGNPLNRYPARGFAYDLQTPSAREKFWKDASGKILPRPYLMLDILFNLSFDPVNPQRPRESMEEIRSRPLPEIRRLTVPIR